MNSTFHGALVFLIMLCLCPAAYGQSDSKDVQDAELRFSIQMTSALNNDPKAQFQVAGMYEQGAGTPQNLRMAYLWYTKSANQGYAPAINKLADWEREKQQTESRARERSEELKRRQAEAEAASAAKAARERSEELKRRQAEAEAASATTAAKASPTAETVHTAKEKQSETNRPKDKTKGTTEKSAEKGDVEFKANPCKTPTAKFTSTCQ